MKIIKCWNDKLANGGKLIKYLWDFSLHSTLVLFIAEIEEFAFSSTCWSKRADARTKADGMGTRTIFNISAARKLSAPNAKTKAKSFSPRRAFEWLMLMGMLRCLHICLSRLASMHQKKREEKLIHQAADAADDVGKYSEPAPKAFIHAGVRL